MTKIMHVQTVLLEEEIKALKIKTHESSTKEALSKAVMHFLKCEHTNDEDMWSKKLERILKNKGGDKNETV